MKLKSTFSAPLLFIVALILLAASRYIDLEALAYKENICLALIVLQLLILVVPTAFYSKIKGDGYVKRLRFAPFGIEKLLATLLAALTLIIGDTLIKMLLYRTGAIEGAYSVYYYYLNGYEPGVLYSLVTFALVPSICEELFFRSVLCAEYEHSGAITAVIASSLFYAMFAMNFAYLPVYFFAGVMFALVMYMTRSVFASMLCHLVYAVFELAAGDTVRTVITKPQSTGFLIFTFTSAFLLCLVVLFGEFERIYYSYALAGKKNDDSAPKVKFDIRKFSEALLAPPLLVAILLFVVVAFVWL